jgi:hypothetical protein
MLNEYVLVYIHLLWYCFILLIQIIWKNILKCYVKWICFSIYTFVMILFYFINTNYMNMFQYIYICYDIVLFY